MTVTVDPELLEEAQETLGAATKGETIRIALSEVVRRRRLERALSHRGRIELEIDAAGLARLREQG